MGNQVPVRDFTPAQIATIKATVARDANAEEFNLFMEVCGAKGLNPFLKQIHALVYKFTIRTKLTSAAFPLS